jgi:hypothetical protein
VRARVYSVSVCVYHCVECSLSYHSGTNMHENAKSENHLALLES